MRRFHSEKELHELGFVRAYDGALLDNKDGFYDEKPDTVATYDVRTHIAVSRNLLWKLLDAALESPDLSENANSEAA